MGHKHINNWFVTTILFVSLISINSQLEKKYQEQIKTLQLEIETERELLISQSAKQQHNLESEIKRLKEEENKLKDKLVGSQKDVERLEVEVLEMSDRCGEVERQNLRQAKELDSVVDLQRKVGFTGQRPISLACWTHSVGWPRIVRIRGLYQLIQLGLNMTYGYN